MLDTHAELDGVSQWIRRFDLPQPKLKDVMQSNTVVFVNDLEYVQVAPVL